MQEVRYWYSTKEEREAFDRENREAEALALEQTGSWDAGQTETTAQDFAAEQDFTVIHGDVTLGVKGAGFHVIFSYSEHGMVSLVYDGLEWIYRPGMPAFWRASTENDKGNGFPVKSAVWCGATSLSGARDGTPRRAGARCVLHMIMQPAQYRRPR